MRQLLLHCFRARRGRTIFSILLIVFIFVCMVSVLDTPTIRAQQTSPPFDLDQVPTPASPPMATIGRSIYSENCTPCHGPEGLGDGPTAASLPGPPTAFADPEAIWDKSPAQLFFTAKFGRIEKLMPPWQNSLTDSQIWHTIAYAWSLHTSESDVNEGAELYTANCARCHGETGAGDGPEATGTMPDFTDLAYTMARSQTDWVDGWQAAHADIGSDWSPAQQHNVLEYIRTFSYVPPWESSYRPGPGVIQGQVTQGTPDGMDVAGLNVTLDAFIDFSPIATFTTTVDAEGQFQFTDLAVDPNIAYLASASARDINYSSPVLNLSPEESSAETTITIYEPTNDASGINVDRAHWIIESQPGALIVGQIFAFGNSLDRTFIGTQEEGADVPVTVAMQVPDGAEQVGFENGSLGERFRRVGDLIYDTAPIVPGAGTRQVIMRYALPYDGTSVELDQDFLYPIRNLNLLIADLPQLQVDIPALSSAGSQDIQGNVYQIWQGQDLQPQSIAISLSGLLEAGTVDPRSLQANSGSGAQGTNPAAPVPLMESWMPWALVGIILVGLMGMLYWSWQNGLLTDDTNVEAVRRQRTELIRRIAHLDDLHAMGELDEQSWRQRRAQLKASLLAVTTELQEASN